MKKMRRWLAALLALSMLWSLTALAEEDYLEPTVQELGEVELPIEPDAPEAPAEEVPAPEETPAIASGEAAPEETPAEDAAPEEDPEAYAVAAPASFPTSLTLGVKEKLSLNGLLLSGGQAVTYASSKPKIASVDESGAVLARKAGKATITVFQGETALGACEVTVMKAPKKLAYPDKSIVMSKDQTRAYPVSMPKGCAGTVTYASDNPAVLTVDAAGNLRGVSGGSATVTATAYNGKKASCDVRVLGGPAPTWVKLNEASANIPVKGTLQLTASFDAGRDAILTWSTSNKKLVTVSDSGLVTAKKAGQATVTVTTHNGLTAACNVQVYVEPKKVSLNAKKLTLNVNDGYQLTATLTKNSVTTLTWGSDNPGVVSVDGNGLLAANKAGTANVTVTTANGKKATCKVTVEDASGSTGAGNVVFEENTPTLKVKIVNDHEVILCYVWVADANAQLHKHYYNGKTPDILKNAVSKNGLQDKLVIGFNGSPPVSEKYCPTWNKHSRYHLREPLPLMITEGQVLVNEPNDVNADKYIYWIDSSGWLHATDRLLGDYSADERKSVYEKIIASGTRNTFIWRPILIKDYKAVPFTDKFIKKTNWKQKKHALCQIDEHNYLVVTSMNKGLMDYPHFQKYLLGLGVRTAVELDAGASSSFMYKSRGMSDFKKFVTGRPNTSMLYFTE